MKLFYATNTSSMACVTEILELDIPCELVEVSWKENRNVEELERLNPLGRVPTLVTDQGEVLTQNVAILEYLADNFSNGEHLAPVGTMTRAKTISWLSFSASDLHKAFVPAFRAEDMTTVKEAQPQIEEFSRAMVRELIGHIDRSLEGKKYISGDKFTIADCYLFTLLPWSAWIEVEALQYRYIGKYIEQMKKRVGVARALEIENA